MDLMTLAAKIVLDDSSYKQGVKNAESMGENLTKRMSAMTVAAGQLMADVVRKSVSAIGSVIKGAVDGYADYQQLIGGVETLFKGSADRVAKYAEQSYKTTGLSANAYMETVTSFSASLLQGLGGNTEAAADIANMAVVDMADNANKMGTDMSSIQAAYMGFAKQNFTMLDNLKLGYGGTRSEMVRLINDSGILEDEITDLDGITFDQLVNAIHKIQEQMGITGTTAKEAAETISGSKASLQAAWTDFLTSVGGETDKKRLDAASERFKATFKTYVENNLAPQIATTMENAPTLISAVSEAITSLPSKAVSDLVGKGVNILTATVEGAAEIGGWLIDGLVGVFKDINADPSKIADLGNAVGSFIGSALSDIATNAPTIISGLFTAGVSLASSLIEGLFSGLFGTDNIAEETYSKIDKELADGLKEAEKSSVKAEGIIDYLGDLVGKYGEAAKGTEEWAEALKKLEEVMPGATEYIQQQNTPLGTTVKNLQQIREELRQTAIENAKRKALEEKESAWLDLVAQAASLQTEIDMAESQRTIAGEKLGAFFNNLYAGNPEWRGFDYAAYQENPNRLLGDWGLINMAKNAGDINDEQETQLRAWAEAFTNTGTDVESMKTQLSDLNGQIAIAQEKYQLASEAIDKAVSADGKAETATNSLAGAMEAAASRLNALSFGGGAGGFFTGGIAGAFNSFASGPLGSLFMPRAVGIDYVPYSGFKTELHRGEAVITAEENARRRNGASADEFAEAMESALITAMNRVGVYMSGDKVGDLTTRRVKNNINEASHARMRSMGG